MQIRLNKDQKIQVTTSKDLYGIMQRILKRQGKIRIRQEYFWVVGLETDGTINFIELLNIGTLNRVSIEPRELFRIAVIKNVDRVLFVHNHPSGNLVPSRIDKAFTKRFREAGELLGIQVIDHLIITEKEYYSFADEGVKF